MSGLDHWPALLPLDRTKGRQITVTMNQSIIINPSVLLKVCVCVCVCVCARVCVCVLCHISTIHRGLVAHYDTPTLTSPHA